MSKPDEKLLKLIESTKKCIKNKCSTHSKKLKSYIDNTKKKYKNECKNSKIIMEQSCLNKFLNDREYIELKKEVKECGLKNCYKEASEVEKSVTVKMEQFLKKRKKDNKIKIKGIKIVLKNKTAKNPKTLQDLVESVINNKVKKTLQYYYDRDLKTLKSELKQLEKIIKKKTKKKSKK